MKQPASVSLSLENTAIIFLLKAEEEGKTRGMLTSLSLRSISIIGRLENGLPYAGMNYRIPTIS